MKAPARRRAGGWLWLLALPLFLSGAMGLGLWLWAGPGPAARDVTVMVPEGATLTRAAAMLEQAGAIRSARQFTLFTRLLGGRGAIKAGEYRIPPRLSQRSILAMLQAGRTIRRFIVIPEGMPAVLVYATLMKTPQLTGPVAMPEEGRVLPDSYAYHRGEPRQAVLDRMRKAMADYLARAWAGRAPDIAVASPDEALTLASIVEKETGKPEERPMVAAVYSNRLKRGMRLQADPTIIYPITRGRPLGRRILQSEVRARNAYNTYAMRGLPAGPIANPGRASIDAVLHPARSDALYFVADGSGGHGFADTLEQHNANVARWRAYRTAHGI